MSSASSISDSTFSKAVSVFKAVYQKIITISPYLSKQQLAKVGAFFQRHSVLIYVMFLLSAGKNWFSSQSFRWKEATGDVSPPVRVWDKAPTAKQF